MKMKKIFKLVMLLVLLGMSTNVAWGGTYYYAQLTASVSESSPSGAGLVYVAKANGSADTYATSSTDKIDVDDGGNGTDTIFTVYAQANHNYVFNGWSSLEGHDANNYADPDYEDGYDNTSNPTIVRMTAPTSSVYDSKSGGGGWSATNIYNYATINANFIANPETPFDVEFLSPLGSGTYSVSSTMNYPDVTPGSSTIPSYSNDIITLTASNGEGYGFRRFYYYGDDENRKTTIGTLGDKVQTLTLTSDMKHIGCEFIAAWEANYVTASNGSYTAKNGSTDITVDDDPATTQTTYADDNITLSATPNTGYAFYRFTGSDGSNIYTIGTIGQATQTVHIPQNTISVTAEFTNKPFLAANNTHSTLEGAIQATRQSDGSYSGVILQLLDYTVPAGYYTIPEGVTLLIPREVNQVEPDGKRIERLGDKNIPSGAYRTLTLQNGVNLSVYGTIEVGGYQSVGTAGTGGDPGVGRPGGSGNKYGQMIMEKGSSITLNDGAVLCAWGFITGDGTTDEDGNYLSGEINARRGSIVREQFQMQDWKGGSCSLDMTSDYGINVQKYKVFPVTQYYIQNIEVPTTYRPGSKLIGSTGINLSYLGMYLSDAVGIVGAEYSVDRKDSAMFLMDNKDDSEDTWVRKVYDVKNDLQVYEVNNSARLGSLIFDMDGREMDSRKFILPITNNMKIHLLTGEMQVTQATQLLPGAQIEVDKKSAVTINSDQTLYLYDADNWGNYVRGTTNGSNDVFTYAGKVKYRPGGRPNVRTLTAAGLGDAQLNVHGTLSVKGYLKTTDAGANIYSNIDDAGTITFVTAAPTESANDSLYQTTSTGPAYGHDHVVPALLRNDAGSSYGTFTETASTAAGQSFCFVDIDEDGNGEWMNLTQAECFVYDQNNVYYIKPQAYVPISVGEPVERADHTYRDEYAGTDRIFINAINDAGDCEWWEVETVEGTSELFHCTHPLNDTYYYYDEDDGWVEKKFNITFKNWDGTVLTFINAEDEVQDHYELPYGSMPNWLSGNPTRPADIDTTYSFTGWTPALHTVTSDQVYMATYAKTPIKYTIIFKFVEDVNDGAEIDRQQLVRNAWPTEPTITKDGYYLDWTPAISAVTGNATYEARWLETPPTEYEVTFFDYDGAELRRTNVAVGVTPTPPADPEGKPATSDYTYVFDHWSPTIEAVTLTSPKSYTAIYEAVPRKYTIKFYQENGSTQIGETQQVTYGAMPNVPAYSKDATSAKTYTLVWSPLVGPATANQNYTATFTETTRQYRVDWKVIEADLSERIVDTKYVDYGATPAYSGSVPTKATANGKAYTFTGWDRDFETVEGAQTYIAQFSERDVVMTVTTAETLSSSVSMETVTIEVGGKLTLSGGAVLTTDVLILESNGTSSGQLDAALVNATNAYFDWTMNGTDGTQYRTWYAIAVPWEVNAETGISIKGGRTLVLGRDFDLVWYDGAERAANGDGFDCWKYVEYESDKIMHPGRLYMMYFGPTGIQTVSFAKAAGAAVIYNSPVSVQTYAVGTGDNMDGNWNGIANPRTYYASLGTGASYAQVLNNGSLDDYQVNHPENNPVYKTINLATSTFNVGKPLFVQAVNPQSVVVTKTSSANIVYNAPRRAKANANTPEGINAVFAVTIGTESNHAADNLFVQVAEEDKADEYVIGQDLAKGGVAKSIPQLWINRYDAKLSVNTQSLTGNTADYPLSLYAPKAGEYTIHSTPYTSDSDYDLYLTQNGRAIWNLSNSAYTLALPQGTTTGYGLRIGAKSPEVATGVDEAVVDAQGETRKVLINGQVFIIRGNNVYSVDGQLVK